MEIKGLLEIILYVQDMAMMVQFYRDVLGLKVTIPVTGENLKHLYWVTFETGQCTLALHGGGSGNTGLDAPKFVFRVDDVPASRAALIEQKVEMGEMRSPSPGVEVCDGKDPEGNVFSIESQDNPY